MTEPLDPRREPRARHDAVAHRDSCVIGGAPEFINSPGVRGDGRFRDVPFATDAVHGEHEGNAMYSAKCNHAVTYSTTTTTTTMIFAQCTPCEQVILRTACEIGFGSMWNIWVTDGVILPGMFRIRRTLKLNKHETYRARRLEDATVLCTQQFNCVTYVRGTEHGMMTVTVQDGLPDQMHVDDERALSA